MAIEHANRVCSWQETMFGEDLPESWMWPFDDLIEDHFEEIAKRKDEKSSGGSGNDDSSGFTQNELTKGLRK